MEITTVLIQNNLTDDFVNWKTAVTNLTVAGQDLTTKLITVFHSFIASVGIIGNFNVIVVFLNHKKYRRKIPNIFILNQVSKPKN